MAKPSYPHILPLPLSRWKWLQKKTFLCAELSRIYCYCSVTKSCLTLCNPMDCSTPGFPVLHYLPEFAQTHVHWVGDAIQTSHPLLPLLFPPSIFPASGAFPVSQLFTSDAQSIGASALAPIYPMNIQGWLHLGLTGWISLLSKGLSRVFSSTTVRKHQFLGAHLPFGPTLTSIHDYWKNHNLG